MTHIRQSARLALFSLIIALLLLPACELLPTIQPPATAIPTPGPTRTPQPATPVTFTINVPNNTPLNSDIRLVVLDTVIGGVQRELALIPSGDFTYAATLELPDGALLFYRYERVAGGQRFAEVAQDAALVDYRVYHTDAGRGPIETIAAWRDLPAANPGASLTGILRDASTGAPVSGVVVALNGQRTRSDWQGRYTFATTTSGPTLLTAFTPDGRWRTVSIAPTLAAGPNTLDLSIPAARAISVGFLINAPADIITGAPLYLTGNVYQLGATLDLQPGGGAVVASRQPALQTLPDGRLLAVLSLYEGQYLRYRYTLGNGRFNGEINDDGTPRVRDFVVPREDVTLQEQPARFTTPGYGPVTFIINTPLNTPAADNVALQLFFDSTWQPPIPMWRLGANSFTYILFNPLNVAGDIGYRVCRNMACATSAGLPHAGPSAVGYRFTTSTAPQTQVQTVDAWQFWGDAPLYTPAGPPQNPRPWMTTGIGLPTAPDPASLPALPGVVAQAASLNVNTVRIPVVWEITTSADIRPHPTLTVPEEDLIAQIRAAQSAGLRVALYPQIQPSPTGPYAGDLAAFWNAVAPSATTTFWDIWFNNYTLFLLHHANLAERTGVDYLYVGGYALGPALPGEPPVPAPSADGRWRALIDQTRTVYSRALVFQLQASSFGLRPITLDYIESVNALDVQWQVPLTPDPQPTRDALQAVAFERLTVLITPLLRQQRQVWLSLRYPAATGGASQCVVLDGTCAAFSRLNPALGPNPALTVDLSTQATTYDALLLAIEQFNQIEGVLTDDYAVSAAIHGPGLSVRGTPAEQVLTLWYRQWLTGSPAP